MQRGFTRACCSPELNQFLLPISSALFRRLFHSCAAKTTNSSRGQPTPRMAVVSVWSLEEDTLKATFT